MKNLDHIKLQVAETGASAEPVNQQLLAAAMLAKNSIQHERNALQACHADPRTGLVTDAAGVLALQGYDAVLSSLNAAIAAAEQQAYGFTLYDCQRQVVQAIAAAEQAQQTEPVAWFYSDNFDKQDNLYRRTTVRDVAEGFARQGRRVIAQYDAAQPPAQQQAEPVQNAKLATAIQQADLAEVAAEAERRQADPGRPQAVGFFSGWVEGGEDGQPVEFMVTAYGDLPPVGTKLYAQPPAQPVARDVLMQVDKALRSAASYIEDVGTEDDGTLTRRTKPIMELLNKSIKLLGTLK